MPIFSAITSKIFGAIALALLILLGLSYLDARHWHKLADQRAATIAQVKDDQAKATAAAQAAHDAQEQRYKDLADAADQKHAADVASADDAVARYIATHRVPACPSGAASHAASGASGGGAESAVRSDPAPVMVTASEDDIRTCTSNTLRLEAARDWAMGLNQ